MSDKILYKDLNEQELDYLEDYRLLNLPLVTDNFGDSLSYSDDELSEEHLKVLDEYRELYNRLQKVENLTDEDRKMYRYYYALDDYARHNALEDGSTELDDTEIEGIIRAYQELKWDDRKEQQRVAFHAQLREICDDSVTEEQFNQLFNDVKHSYYNSSWGQYEPYSYKQFTERFVEFYEVAQKFLELENNSAE